MSYQAHTFEATEGAVIEQDATRAFFVFCINGAWIGVPVDNVDAVLDKQLPMPLPRVPGHIVGLVPSGKQSLVIFDLGRFLAITSPSGNDNDAVAHMPRLVVVSDGDCIAGIPVDRAAGVIQVAEEKIKSPEVMCGESIRAYLTGELEMPFGVVGLIDLPRVLEAASV